MVFPLKYFLRLNCFKLKIIHLKVLQRKNIQKKLKYAKKKFKEIEKKIFNFLYSFTKITYF